MLPSNMSLSILNAYNISGFAMAIWRVFKMKLNYKFVHFLKNSSYTFLTIRKLKKNIFHQVGHTFKIFESGLSHKQQETTS